MMRILHTNLMLKKVMMMMIMMMVTIVIMTMTLLFINKRMVGKHDKM